MTAKKRTPIPRDIEAEVMFRNDRTCCICQKRKKRLQIHHINENPADHRLSNLAVICFECHDEVMIKGGIGRILSKSQVRKYKNQWEEVVATQRQYKLLPVVIEKFTQFDERGRIRGHVERHVPCRDVVTPIVGEVVAHVRNPALIAGVCNHLGDLKARSEKHSSAQILYHEALRHAKSAKDQEFAATCLFKLGTSVGRQGKHQEALKYFKEATKMKSDDPRVWYNRGLSALAVGQEKAAIYGWRKSVQFGTEQSDLPVVAKAYRELGTVHAKQKNWEKAIAFYQRALDVGTKAERWDDVADAHLRMGVCLDEMGSPQEALRLFCSAIEIAKKAKAWAVVASAHYDSGVTLTRVKGFRKAAVSYRRAIRCGLKAKSLDVVARSYCMIAYDLCDSKKYGKAVDAAKQAIRFGEESKSSHTVAYACLLCAECSCHLSYHADAIAMYQKAITLGTELEDWEMVAMSHYGIANPLHELGHDLEAVDACLRAAELGKYLPAMGREPLLRPGIEFAYGKCCSLLYEAAIASIRTKDHDQARALATKLLKIHERSEEDGGWHAVDLASEAFAVELPNSAKGALRSFRRIVARTKSRMEKANR